VRGTWAAIDSAILRSGRAVSDVSPGLDRSCLAPRPAVPVPAPRPAVPAPRLLGPVRSEVTRPARSRADL